MTDYQMISEFDVPVKMRDGIVLRANIYRPNREGKWPVLLHRHPYNKDNPPVSFGLYDISRAVRQGYVVQGEDLLLKESGSFFRSVNKKLLIPLRPSAGQVRFPIAMVKLVRLVNLIPHLYSGQACCIIHLN